MRSKLGSMNQRKSIKCIGRKERINLRKNNKCRKKLLLKV